MALNARKIPSTGGNGMKNNTPPLDAGTYPVRLVQLIDLGVQEQRPYKGTEKPPAHMIKLTYEFLDEFMCDEDGNELEDKPRFMSEDFPFYPLEVENARSTKRYHTLDPDEEFEGDFAQLICTPAMLTVVCKPDKKDKDKIWNNVGDLAPMREKDIKKAPDLVNEPKVFDLEDPDMDVFNSLSSYVQDQIKANLDFKGSVLEGLIKSSPKSPSKPGDDEPKKSKGKAKSKPKKADKGTDDSDEDDDW